MVARLLVQARLRVEQVAARGPGVCGRPRDFTITEMFRGDPAVRNGLFELRCGVLVELCRRVESIRDLVLAHFTIVGIRPTFPLTISSRTFCTASTSLFGTLTLIFPSPTPCCARPKTSSRPPLNVPS